MSGSTAAAAAPESPLQVPDGGRPLPRLGAHIKVGGGLAGKGMAAAREVGAEAVQVFLGNPRGWAAPAGDPRQDEKFRGACAEAAMPAYVHAPYLINLGSPTAETVEHSVTSLEHAVLRGRQIGALGVVVHTGSAVAAGSRDAALRQVRERLLPVLDGISDDGPLVLLEPTAGQGESLCATVAEVAPYLAILEDHPRLGICLDTCHVFAAGHDLAREAGMTATLDALVAAIGPGRLRLVHANDSKDEVGSGRDRHEHLGSGRIGERAFAELLEHPAVQDVPVVIETPGKADARAADLSLLKRLREQRWR